MTYKVLESRKDPASVTEGKKKTSYKNSYCTPLECVASLKNRLVVTVCED